MPGKRNRFVPGAGLKTNGLREHAAAIRTEPPVKPTAGWDWWRTYAPSLPPPNEPADDRERA